MLKIETHIPLTPQLQAQILYNVAMKITARVEISRECSIDITQNDCTKCDGSTVICSQEWITVMRVLNNISLDTKGLILRALGKFSSKLLLMIDVVLLMHHCDIIFVILDIIFDILRSGHTYEVYTYVNNKSIIKPLVCYSKLCGFEYNPYDMSKYLINYFDNARHIHNCERAKAKGICDSEWLIDPEQQLYLTMIANLGKTIIVGKINEVSSSIFAYFFDDDISYLDEHKIIVLSNLTYYCSKGSCFHNFFTRRLNVDEVNIQIYHNLVDGVLC